MRFSKWHALGNSYLLVEEPLDEQQARLLCDPARGIGADGVLEIVALDRSAAELVIWNPDGSTAELSGNGARIAAAWLAGRTGAPAATLRVGEREVRASVSAGGEVRLELGVVHVGAPETLAVAEEVVELIPVSVGNPHAVVRTEPTRETLLRLGPVLERHERFPRRTNVQLVRVDGPGELTVAVWERGAGETQASGTSAVAAAAAAVAKGWTSAPVTVHLPGGDLLVELDAEARATLTGPAVEIARGEFLRR